MGTPDSIIGDTWGYDISSVYFDNDGKVKGWSDISNNLKMSIGDRVAGAVSFSLGSTKQDVINIMGTPDSIIGDTWRYDFSSVYFDNDDKVKGWSDISNNLKVK